MELGHTSNDPQRNSQNSSSHKMIIGKIVAISGAEMEIKLLNQMFKLPLRPGYQLGNQVQAQLNQVGKILIQTLENISLSQQQFSEKLELGNNQSTIQSSYTRQEALAKELTGRIISVYEAPVEAKPKQALIQKYVVEVPGGNVSAEGRAGLTPNEFILFNLGSKGEMQILNPIEEAKTAGLMKILQTNNIEYSPAYRLAFEILKPLSNENIFEKAVIDFGKYLTQSGLIKQDQTQINLPMQVNLYAYLEKALQGFLLSGEGKVTPENLQSWSLNWNNDAQINQLMKNLVPFQPDKNSNSEIPKLDLETLLADKTSQIKNGEPFTLSAIQKEGLEQKGDNNESLRLQKVVESIITEQKFHREEAYEQSQKSYYWYNKRWNPIQVRWGKIEGEESDKNIKFNIELETEDLGNIQVELQLNNKGLSFLFQNEKANVKRLLNQEMDSFKKKLSELDIPLLHWEYSKLKLEPKINKLLPPISGESSSNLDLWV